MTQHEIIRAIKATGRSVTWILRKLAISRSTFYYWSRTNTFPDGMIEKIRSLLSGSAR